MVIGLEAIAIYGESLVYALREGGNLDRFQRKIYIFNPKQIKKFKKAYPGLPKNDLADAFVNADHRRFVRIGKRVYIDDCRYKVLQTRTSSVDLSAAEGQPPVYPTRTVS